MICFFLIKQNNQKKIKFYIFTFFIFLYLLIYYLNLDISLETFIFRKFFAPLKGFVEILDKFKLPNEEEFEEDLTFVPFF